MKSVKITDTTFRDAHQSLMATRMRTDSMLPIAEKIDQVGFHSLEAWGGATFDVCIRFLNEDPWERLRQLKKYIKKTPLQMLLRGQNLVGYRNYPDDVVRKFVEKAAKNGVDIFRVFDALNDTRNLETAVKMVRKVGAHAQGTVCYTLSPVHTVKHYLGIVQRLAELECDSICIKDMAGLLSPKDAFDLIKAFKKEAGLPVQLHCHYTSGMALMTYLRACDADVDVLDTAFSSLAGGTSQPPVETIVAALRNTSCDPKLDMEILVEVADYFRGLREKYFDPIRLIDPMAERIDTGILVHQIPGGMFSNLISQLRDQNASDKLEKVLKEVPRVRKELGYPPLVTPTSQIVGTQAVFNVLSGKRYSIVPKEVKDYVRGLYGKSPAHIDEEVKKKIIGDEEVITQRPADLLKPELNTISEETKQFFEKEEDALTYVLFPQAALEFFRKRKTMIKESPASLLPPQLRQELEEIAAVSTVIASYLKGREEIAAVIPTRKSGRSSPWSLAGRQELTNLRG
ncbi:MAG TPA: oxaloacetate decarboxylase subunit alpha [Candidatus Bathyarchaeia archaeon]|nr:oxaloacetate decarboxylase subunit alpha [Candidatus Bathyarchaeia archaeon]